MPTSFRETDTVANCGQPNSFCTAFGSAAAADARQAILGGTAGTAHSINIAANATDVIAVNWEIPASSLTGLTWAAGVWTVRLHVTTANANLTCNNIAICQVNNACASVSSIASATSLGIILSPNSTFNISVAGVAVPAPSASDTVQIVLTVTNALGSAQAFSYTSDVLIDSPFGTPIPTEEPDQFMAFGPIPAPMLVSLWG